jgi:hypothetical protein
MNNQANKTKTGDLKKRTTSNPFDAAPTTAGRQRGRSTFNKEYALTKAVNGNRVALV